MKSCDRLQLFWLKCDNLKNLYSKQNSRTVKSTKCSWQDKVLQLWSHSQIHFFIFKATDCVCVCVCACACVCVCAFRGVHAAGTWGKLRWGGCTACTRWEPQSLLPSPCGLSAGLKHTHGNVSKCVNLSPFTVATLDHWNTLDREKAYLCKTKIMCHIYTEIIKCFEFKILCCRVTNSYSFRWNVVEKITEYLPLRWRSWEIHFTQKRLSFLYLNFIMHWPSLLHSCMFLISLGFSSSWRGKTKKNPVRLWNNKLETEFLFVWPHQAYHNLHFITCLYWPAARSWLLEEQVSTAFLFQLSTCNNPTNS